MKCTVVIPTRSRRELLSETLLALDEQVEKDFEVMVVCDGEDAETRDLARRHESRYPMGWIFSPMRCGQAWARNAGAAAAKSKILLFLDDDTVPIPELIALHCEHHGMTDGLAVVGKTLETYLRPPGSRTESLMRHNVDNLLARAQDRAARKGHDFIRYVWFGVNCSIQRVTFEASGGFDPSLRGVSGEDFELGVRLCNRGIQFVFEPRALAFHQSTKDLVHYAGELAQQAGRNDVYRIRCKQERSPQTERATAILSEGLLRRLGHRAAWHYPETFERGAALFRWVTDRTGSRTSFRLWRSLIVTKYWMGVREAGETLQSLRRLVGAPLPALMFHSICVPRDRHERVYCISPHKYSQLLKWIRAMGFASVLPQDWLAANAPVRGVLLTFDDGYEDFHREAFPVLEELGFRPLVFLVAGRIGQISDWTPAARGGRRLLTLEQIRELHRHGVRFGSHSLTHPWLTRLSVQALQQEVTDSKRLLEDLLGGEVDCFAYPFGDVDARVRGAVAEAGYRFGMSTMEGRNGWGDPLCMRRTNVSEADNLLNFTLKLITGCDFRAAGIRWLSAHGLGWLRRRVDNWREA